MAHCLDSLSQRHVSGDIWETGIALPDNMPSSQLVAVPCSSIYITAGEAIDVAVPELHADQSVLSDYVAQLGNQFQAVPTAIGIRLSAQTVDSALPNTSMIALSNINPRTQSNDQFINRATEPYYELGLAISPKLLAYNTAATIVSINESIKRYASAVVLSRSHSLLTSLAEQADQPTILERICRQFGMNSNAQDIDKNRLTELAHVRIFNLLVTQAHLIADASPVQPIKAAE